jgi:putative ABC transport system substrate-binding protein
MKRRQVIAGLGAAAALSFSANAQQSDKLPVVGFLVPGEPATHSHRVSALVQRLSQLGWIERRNVSFEYRWTGGDSKRSEGVAAEFVKLKVNVIVTAGTEPVNILRLATSIIPIVFATTGDPVGAGLVASLARPGGNITGLSLQQTEVAGKRLELLREMVTGIQRLAVLTRVGNPSVALEVEELQKLTKLLGLDVVQLKISTATDIATAFSSLKSHADALYVPIDPLLTTHRVSIVSLALAERLPSAYGTREFAEAGGLFSYGANSVDLYRRAADFVDKILRGVKPENIPIEQPTKFDFVVNMKSAKALGLTIPPTLLARADEVIE